MLSKIVLFQLFCDKKQEHFILQISVLLYHVCIKQNNRLEPFYQNFFPFHSFWDKEQRLEIFSQHFLCFRAYNRDPGWTGALYQQRQYHQPDLSREVCSRTSSHHALEPQPGGECIVTSLSEYFVVWNINEYLTSIVVWSL